MSSKNFIVKNGLLVLDGIAGITVGNSAANVTINATSISATSNNANNLGGLAANAYANNNSPVISVSINVGANVSMNTSTLYLGNSQTNTTVNSSVIASNRFSGNGVMSNATPLWANTPNVVMTTDSTNAGFAFQPLTDASTIVWDLGSGINFSVVLSTSRILGNPTNTALAVGKSGLIKLVQPAGGAAVLSYGNQLFADSAGFPIIDVGANKETLLSWSCVASGVTIIGMVAKGYK